MLLLCLFGFDFMGSAKELYEDRGAERKEDCEHVAVSPFTIPPPPNSGSSELMHLHLAYQTLTCNSHFFILPIIKV